MKFLVLGSEGVVGSSFCNELDKLSCDSFSYTRWDIKLSKNHDLRDVKNIPLLKKHIDNSDFVLFAAYDVGGSKFLNNLKNDNLDNNLKMMTNVFSCLGNKRFIFCTSVLANINSNSYGLCKKIGEKYSEQIGGICVRLWNIYGYEHISIRSHVINDFISSAVSNNVINIKTSGTEKRQMLEDSDCARALIEIFKNYDELKSHLIIDVSSGEWISIYEIANIIKHELNIKDINLGKEPDNCHIMLFEPNLEIIKKYWQPSVSLVDGIKKIIQKGITTPIITYTPTVETLIHKTVFGKGDSDKHLMVLFSMILQTNSVRILELGVRKGDTTLPLLMGANITGGFVTSVDVDDTLFKCPESLKHIWKFHKMDALKYIKSCNGAIEPWDFIFIDDWHSYDHVKKELELLDSQISPSTIIILHDLMYANYQPHYHSDIAVREGQWANGGPYRAVAELNPNFWEFATIPSNNGLTLLRKKYSGLYFN